MNKVQQAVSQLLTTAQVGVGIAKGYQTAKEKEARELEREQAIATEKAEKEAKIEAKEKEKAQKEEAKTQAQAQKEKAIAEKKRGEEDALIKESVMRASLEKSGVRAEDIEKFIQREKLGALNPRSPMRNAKGKTLFTEGTTMRRIANMSLAGATLDKYQTDESLRQRLLSLGRSPKGIAKNLLTAETGGNK
jgi:uncharacterized membrane protein YqiK